MPASLPVWTPRGASGAGEGTSLLDLRRWHLLSQWLSSQPGSGVAREPCLDQLAKCPHDMPGPRTPFSYGPEQGL